MTCPYCSQGDVSVELFGFAIHKLPDRWISCSARNTSTPFRNGVIATRERTQPDQSRPLIPAKLYLRASVRAQIQTDL